MDIKKDYYIKDPVHKEIDFKKDKWILELLECEEVIRLEGIYQLGVSYKIFPSASHNRLMHSLGTFQVAKKFADFFEDKISLYQRKLFLASALLHDIGHGPFSHVFEKISKINHEDVTKKWFLIPMETYIEFWLKTKLNQWI
ncbi:HD domain-containing protein [Malacoplasma iowae]|uniref:HD domain-containing protein n=1 Tax=Malacoplasma iowae TaxID=2116 RepID=UPI00055F25E9|nr:HD domain-containing protein [Malacoplasma iowae]